MFGFRIYRRIPEEARVFCFAEYPSVKDWELHRMNHKDAAYKFHNYIRTYIRYLPSDILKTHYVPRALFHKLLARGYKTDDIPTIRRLVRLMVNETT